MITIENNTGRRRAIGLAAALACMGGVLTAAESPAPPEAHKGWETTAAAGATLTRGNSETFLATMSLDTQRKWVQDEALLGISGGYGESKVNGVNTKNTEFLQGFGQYNHLFTERFYGALRLDGKYDDIAGTAYKF